MKRLSILMSVYVLLMVAFIVISVEGQKNYDEYYASGEFHYNQESRVSLNKYESGGTVTTENTEYEVRINIDSDDVSFSKDGNANYNAYGNYGNNEVGIYKFFDGISGTIKYEDGTSLGFSTDDQEGRNSSISYYDGYNNSHCTIYVDDNLQQVDDVDVQACYDLFSMEDVEKLKADIEYFEANYDY